MNRRLTLAELMAGLGIGARCWGGHWTTVPMGHVVDSLRRYIREHWEVLRHAQIKDSTLGLLALIEKWGSEPQDATRRKPG